MTAPEPVAVLERRLAAAVLRLRHVQPRYQQVRARWDFALQQVADLERLLSEARERER